MDTKMYRMASPLSQCHSGLSICRILPANWRNIDSAPNCGTLTAHKMPEPVGNSALTLLCCRQWNSNGSTTSWTTSSRMSAIWRRTSCIWTTCTKLGRNALRSWRIWQCPLQWEMSREHITWIIDYKSSILQSLASDHRVAGCGHVPLEGVSPPFLFSFFCVF